MCRSLSYSKLNYCSCRRKRVHEVPTFSISASESALLASLSSWWVLARRDSSRSNCSSSGPVWLVSWAVSLLQTGKLKIWGKSGNCILSHIWKIMMTGLVWRKIWENPLGEIATLQTVWDYELNLPADHRNAIFLSEINIRVFRSGTTAGGPAGPLLHSALFQETVRWRKSRAKYIK